MTTFVFKFTGSGWAVATISDGTATATIDNITSDSAPLRSLLSALANLLDGQKRAQFSWWDEHGEFQWLLTSRDQILFARITRYRMEPIYRKPNDRGKPLLKLRCDLREFATAVFEQLRERFETLGPTGFEDQWIRPFPLSEFQRLGELLSRSAASGASSA